MMDFNKNWIKSVQFRENGDHIQYKFVSLKKFQGGKVSVHSRISNTDIALNLSKNRENAEITLQMC